MYTQTGFDMPAVQQVRNLWQRIAAPVIKRVQVVISCGLTPRELALTLCLGSALGVMPLVCGVSLICIIVAHVMRLNQVALQSVNYLLWPAQLALFVPFFKLGAWLFPGGPPVQQHLLSAFVRSPDLSALNTIGWMMIKALAAWMVTALPAALLIYLIMRATVSARLPKGIDR